MIRVAVVAPAMAMRLGLRQVLSSLPDVDVVADAAHVDELSFTPADVLVITSAADLSALALDHAPAVLLLTDVPDDLSRLQQRLSLPAWGVLPVNASEEELGAALRALGEGLWVGAPALLQDLLSRKAVQVLDGDADFTAEPLTGRELEVLQLTAEGLANKQIAVKLGISEHTVKFHLSSLYAKLGVTSRTEAVRAGARRGLVVL